MKKSGNLAVYATLILAGSLLAACGSTDPLANRQAETNSTTPTQVTISGAGASSQETAMNA